MPTISWFNGISIRMFFNDHPPPHFHASFGGRDAQVEIETGRILRGRLPPAQRRLVEVWTLRYHDRLMACWREVEADRLPPRIPGLGSEDDD